MEIAETVHSRIPAEMRLCSMEQKKAIIIGAGPAGLTAAYLLLKETDILPVIYEESDAIGGISQTVQYKGNRMDLGGHRFFSKSPEVNRIWQELMPMQGSDAKDDKMLGREKKLLPGGPDPDSDDRVMLLRDRVSRILYNRKFFDYPISLKMSTLTNMGFSKTMSAGFGYLKSAMNKREEVTLEDFMINRFGTPLYKMFFEDYTEKLWGRNPKDISADWGAQRIKGLSIKKAVAEMLKKPFVKNSKNVETSLIEQFSYPKFGPGQFWETMADEIVKMGGEIHKNTKITAVNTQENKIVSVTAEQNGQQISVDGGYFVSTMPIKDLIAGMGVSVPEPVKKIALELPYRDFMTVGLLVKKLNLQNKTKMKTVSDIVPDCWIYVQESDVKIGRLQIFNNWSPYMVKDLENTIFIGLEYFCNEGDDMWNMADNDFIQFAVSELEKIGILGKDDVLDATRLRVKKAYPAYFGSYQQFDQVKDYLNTFENLFCLGRNGQHRYNNMDHSMMTAMEFVKNVKNGIASKDNIWNVNTEEEYHEE